VNVTQAPWVRIGIIAAVVVVLCATAAAVLATRPASQDELAGRTYTVQRGTFRRIVHRTGILQPLNEQTVFARVNGTIKELLPQGGVVKKDDVVMRVDSRQFEDAKEDLESNIQQREAEYEKTKQDSLKSLNQEQQNVESFKQRVDLETARLNELLKGPLPVDEVKAETDIKSNKELLKGAEEECAVYEELGKINCVPQQDVFTKEMAVVQAKEKVADAENALKTLNLPDQVKIATQKQAITAAQKGLSGAQEKVAIIEGNIKRDAERAKFAIDQQKAQLNKRLEDIAHCVTTAPGPGVVIHNKMRWFMPAPGRDVWDGIKVMSIPDFSKMKVALTVDEARIGSIHVGLPAELRPAGWMGTPFNGKVTKVAEKGRDEFELFQADTTQISGTANRQVFDVSVEIDNPTDAMRLGLRTDVDIILQTIENALIVPRIALFRQPSGEMQLRVVSSVGTELRTVKVVAEDEINAAVEGVKEGEKIWLMGD
jgi:multidrug efflux pump subunit AcrA (membrane-fusion protein)